LQVYFYGLICQFHPLDIIYWLKFKVYKEATQYEKQHEKSIFDRYGAAYSGSGMQSGNPNRYKQSAIASEHDALNYGTRPDSGIRSSENFPAAHFYWRRNDVDGTICAYQPSRGEHHHIR
jgi:hypothetical protein